MLIPVSLDSPICGIVAAIGMGATGRLKVIAEKLRQFFHRHVHILRYIVGPDMCRTGNQEQLLVLCSCRLAVALLVM